MRGSVACSSSDEFPCPVADVAEHHAPNGLRAAEHVDEAAGRDGVAARLDQNAYRHRVSLFSKQRGNAERPLGADGSERDLMAGRHLTDDRHHATVWKVRRGNRVADAGERMADTQLQVFGANEQRRAVVSGQLPQ